MKGNLEQIRYPETFKRKVISEIESGQISAYGAGIKYGIGGKMTIYNWLKKDKYLQNEQEKVSLIDMKTSDKEPDIDKMEQEQEIKCLKSELKKAQLKAEANEILVQIAKEKYGIDLGKLGAKR